jgi:hypothetical protein
MPKQEDANLILKLYELRREETMRAARDWYVSKFNPQTPQDVLDAIVGEKSAYFRMVASYWEMAATLVNHGAIDMDLFCEANGEQFLVYAKIESSIPALREQFGNPRMFANLEKLVNTSPNGRDAVARWQARFKTEAEKARAQQAAASA